MASSRGSVKVRQLDPCFPRHSPTHDVQGNDLSVGLLDLLQLSEVVPESGLGDNIVGGKDPHSAVNRQSRLVVTSFVDSLELGGLLSLGGELSPNDGVLGESAHSIDGSACHPIQSQHSTRPDTCFLLPNGSERICRLLKARKSDSKRRSP